MIRRAPLTAMVLLLAGCAGRPPMLPSGPDAYSLMQPPGVGDSGDIARPYRIGPLDLLTINVFRVQSLSMEGVQVDAGGNILFPLLGQLHASGKTPNEFAAEISRQLRTQYLENPQVSVLVTKTTSQNVTILGSVTDPGIYEMKGQTTLLDALALAKGTNRVAKLKQVTVFRTVGGKRMGALFDARAIQRGEAADPEILGNDTVVVGLDHVAAAWRDVLLAAPLAAVFTPLSVR